MTCQICHGRGYYTEPSTHDYRFGATVTRTCDCVPRDPPTRVKTLLELDDEVAEMRARYAEIRV